ncbi:MAG TPA: hypothetical protein VJT14_13370 [Candidatus Dormibacteraeota bacterium]|nr:hypothetical protein [Candidatus Dormibacteraeota bacterium]
MLSIQAKTGRATLTACASPQGEAKRQRRYSREHWVIGISPTSDAVCPAQGVTRETPKWSDRGAAGNRTQNVA